MEERPQVYALSLLQEKNDSNLNAHYSWQIISRILRSMARPNMLTPERQERIVGALQAGNTRRASAKHGGIEEGTMLEWIRRGEGRDHRRKTAAFAQFAKAIKEAEAEAEVQYVNVIKDAAAAGNWQAAAWWLERRKAADYRRVDRLEATGDGGGPQETVVRIIYEDDICDQSTTSGSNGHTQHNGASLQARLKER